MQVLRVTLPTAGILGVNDRELGTRGEANLLAHHREVAGLVRGDGEAEPLGIDDAVEHAAIGDVDGDRTETVDFELGVEPIDESRNIGELDGNAFAVATGSARPHRPGRRVDHDDRLRLVHGDDAGLEQHGYRADQVRSRHRHVFRRLHDDDAGIAIGAGRRRQQIEVARDAAARLAEEEPPDIVVVARHRLHLVEHRGTRRRHDAAGDDIADLALGMAADDRDDAL